MEIPQPESGFVDWLAWFDPALRCRWNPSKHRWVIDEKNRETGVYQTITTWEDNEGKYLDLSPDLCRRLEIMRGNYKKMILSPADYIREKQEQATKKWEQELNTVRDDSRHNIVENIGEWRAAYRNLCSGRL